MISVDALIPFSSIPKPGEITTIAFRNKPACNNRKKPNTLLLSAV
jgi:hypothetical protein